MLGEIIGIAIMAFGAALLIRWGAWILANLNDALDDTSDQFANVGGGVATTRETGGGGPSISAGRRGSGNGSQQTGPSHSDCEAFR